MSVPCFALKPNWLSVVAKSREMLWPKVEKLCAKRKIKQQFCEYFFAACHLILYT